MQWRETKPVFPTPRATRSASTGQQPPVLRAHGLRSTCSPDTPPPMQDTGSRPHARRPAPHVQGERRREQRKCLPGERKVGPPPPVEPFHVKGKTLRVSHTEPARRAEAAVTPENQHLRTTWLLAWPCIPRPASAMPQGLRATPRGHSPFHRVLTQGRPLPRPSALLLCAKVCEHPVTATGQQDTGQQKEGDSHGGDPMAETLVPHDLPRSQREGV